MFTKDSPAYRLCLRFILYSVIGCSGVFIDVIIFYTLVNVVDTNYILANVVSILSGATNNFILNAKINFKVHDKKFSRYISFISIACIGILCSSTIIHICVSKFHLPVMFGKCIAILIVTALQFTLNTLITFRRKR